MVRVQSARIGENPKSGGPDALRLSSRHGAGPPERDPVGADPHERYPAWAKTPHLALEPPASSAQLIGCQFPGRRGCASDEIRDAHTHIGKEMLLPWSEHSGSESREVEHAPEPVSRTSEVKAGGA